MRSRCASDFIDLLDGPTAVAELLGIKAPSVSEWRIREVIPPDKLERLAPHIEVASVKAGSPIYCEESCPHRVWRRIPDKSWPWHRKGRPFIDVTRATPEAA